MSLINDALRKARRAQPAGATTGAADGPELRAPSAEARTRGGSFFTLPFFIVVLLVLAAIMFWAWYQAGRVLVVRANSSAAAVSPAPKASAPKTTATTVASVAPKAAASVAISVAPNASAAAAVGSTNLLMATEAPKPAGPSYRLEGLFYSPKKPSAVINGDLVYVGSPVENGRVVAIDEESATVVTSSGETNLLVLTR